MALSSSTPVYAMIQPVYAPFRNFPWINWLKCSCFCRQNHHVLNQISRTWAMVTRRPPNASLQQAVALWSQDLARFLLPCQLEIQIKQQSQEIPVGVDCSLLDQLLQSSLEREVAVDHEVRQHQSGGAAHSHDAVHQNSPWRADEMKGTGDVREGLARGLTLINIIHGCSSHTVAFLFYPAVS